MQGSLRESARAREHRRAMQELERRERQLRPGYKVWGYKNVFAKGFLVTRGDAAPPRSSWERTAIGRWRALVDPELERDSASSPTAAVLVLGQAFDDSGTRSRSRVAARILRAAEAPGGADAQTAAIDAVVTWLSGRYVVLVARGDRLDAYTDPLAARSLYWHAGASGPALASHTALLSSLAGGLPSERMRWITDNPDYRSPAGRWLPGLITPHDEVGQVYANGRLTVQGDAVAHERFFPREDREELPLADASERFRDELRAQVRNWTSVAPLTVLSLTAGRDSRAVLEAGLVDLQRAKALTMTYHPFHVAAKSTYQDFHTAARLSAAAGLPHLGIDVAPMQPTSQMAGLYRTTFPTWQRYANLANALYLHSPARAATLFGIGGAIITGMWKDTSDRRLTPQLLASKYTSSAFADDPALHAELERWMAFTDFSVDALRGYDFYDFYHWEHRMTKWAGSGYSEYDLATIPAPVLSSRRLLVAALSLPKQQRVDAEVYRSIATDGMPGAVPR
jgi:hypothetical protein